MPMIALLDTSESLTVCRAEIGCDVGQLFSPLTLFSRQEEEGIRGMDNGCFKGFREAAFMALLARERAYRHLFKFVCCPDVVGSARRTLEIFEHWRHNLSGWPVALVMQDGQENMEIPWTCISAVFIGGSTQWKDGPHAASIVRAAKILGKWVHVGRVNTPERWDRFEALGADSVDGSGISRYSWMRERIRDRRKPEPTLFDEEEAA